ncbi:hypothetical protein AX16_000297 [Volvariella volvacea WC 439]|nr:hypothetical protein AX16_000297 [Volvariella volvacea WC 439]
MPPSRNIQHLSNPIATAHSLALLNEYTHTLDSLPLDLSRHFADLRELDAVLSSSMASITSKVYRLINMIEEKSSSKADRLWLLGEIAEEATRLKLGGEDKIRVACQAADNVKAHSNHLRSLSEQVPGFDVTTLNRRTTYPHVAPRSFMPVTGIENGRRRRGVVGSLLVAMADPSPAKRKRANRDEDVDITQPRSPRKDRTTDGPSRSRNNARAKKNERVPSPSESLVSIASHIPQHHNQNGTASSRAAANGTSSRGGNGNNSNNKRSRSGAANNHRGGSPQNEQYYNGNHNDHQAMANGNNGHNGIHPSSLSYTFPPTDHHLPSSALASYNNATNQNGVGTSGRHHSTYDHALSLGNGSEWSAPQQLEGPGMPVARNASNHSTTQNPLSAGGTDGATEAGDDGGDGDDRTYCFCDGVSYGEMIACDDTGCEREWFHLTCIGLEVPPEGRWFCDTCRTKRNKRSGRGGKRRTAASRASAKAT